MATYGPEAVREMWDYGIKSQVIDRLGLKTMVAKEEELPGRAHPCQFPGLCIVHQMPVRLKGHQTGTWLSLKDVGEVVKAAQKDTRDWLAKALGDHKCVCFHPERCFAMTPFVWQPGYDTWLARILTSCVRVSETDIATARRGYKCPAEMSNARA